MKIDEDKCILCEACILICKKKALHFEKKNNGIEIVFKKELCDENCTKCLDICPFAAMEKKENRLKKEKNFIPYGNCDHCGKSIILYHKDEKNLCIKCKRNLGGERLFECSKSFRK